MCRVLIADDHPMVRDGLRTVLAVTFDRSELFEAADLDEAVRVIERERDFDLVLLDVNMPGMNGLGGLADLRRKYPSLPIVVVSAAYDRRLVAEAMRLGAAGFVPKTLARPAIMDALRKVAAGDLYMPPDCEELPEPSGEEAEIIRRIDLLTPQQLRVLQYIVEGRLNKEIAHFLGVSDSTIKAHVSAILQKLQVFSRTQAVILANRINFADYVAAATLKAAS